MNTHLKSTSTLACGLMLVALSSCQLTPVQLEPAQFIRNNRLLKLDLRLREALNHQLSGGTADIITSSGRLILQGTPGIEGKVFRLFKDRRGCLLIPKSDPNERIRLPLLQCVAP